METETKKVSVVMCTYNGARYIREQLDSILNQTYPIYELIVQDDCSTDGTVEIVEEYQTKYPQVSIKIYVNEKNSGFNRNFLTAIQKAEGEYIAIADQDDIWLLNKLEVLLFNIGNHAFIYHNSTLINDRGEEIGLLHKHELSLVLDPLISVLYPRSYGHQIMFSREVQKKAAIFCDENVSYDYLLYSIGCSLTPIRYVSQSLVYWRRYELAVTYVKSARKMGKWNGYVKAIESLFNISNRERTKRYFSLLSNLSFFDVDSQKAVRKMAKNTIFSILSVCFLCLKHRKSIGMKMSNLQRLLRTFFLPLFFIRDHGRYIVND